MDCEYCELDVYFRKNLLDGIYIDSENFLSNDYECEAVKINYCPMCGRKLQEESD